MVFLYLSTDRSRVTLPNLRLSSIPGSGKKFNDWPTGCSGGDVPGQGWAALDYARPQQLGLFPDARDDRGLFFRVSAVMCATIRRILGCSPHDTKQPDPPRGCPKMNCVISVRCGMMVVAKEALRHKMWTKSLGGNMRVRDSATSPRCSCSGD
jgi:hypothetical protein